MVVPLVSCFRLLCVGYPMVVKTGSFSGRRCPRGSLGSSSSLARPSSVLSVHTWSWCCGFLGVEIFFFTLPATVLPTLPKFTMIFWRESRPITAHQPEIDTEPKGTEDKSTATTSTFDFFVKLGDFLFFSMILATPTTKFCGQICGWI